MKRCDDQPFLQVPCFSLAADGSNSSTNDPELVEVPGPYEHRGAQAFGGANQGLGFLHASVENGILAGTAPHAACSPHRAACSATVGMAHRHVSVCIEETSAHTVSEASGRALSIHALLVAGLMVAGCWLLAAGLVAGCWLLGVEYVNVFVLGSVRLPAAPRVPRPLPFRDGIECENTFAHRQKRKETQ